MKLIGIAGKARTGKDTCAQYLWQRFGYTRIAFADPVKLAAQQIFGLSNEETWDDEFKEKAVNYWGMSPRELFQRVGTEAIRGTFGETVWIKRWLLTYTLVKETDHVVVPDVRSDLEAEFLRSLGGQILHITRGSAPTVRAHSSENGVMIKDGDLEYANDKEIRDLVKFLDTIAK